MTIATRGLAFPATRAQARKIREEARYFTRARQILLKDAGEEEWSQRVKDCARFYGWLGRHHRYSQGVIESVHTQWQDGFSESFGEPDWFFWHEDIGEHFAAELKAAHGGVLRPGQKVQFPSLRKGGLTVFEWYPRDMDQVERVFRHGLAAA